MKRTVSIPVNLPRERFLPLMGFCADIFNQHVDWALQERTWNKNKAHKALYEALRAQYPDVPSALVQTIRDNAMEAVKATKFKRHPKKKPTSGLRYDKRTMTIGKRERLILNVPEHFKGIFETWEFRAATLTYSKHSKQFWVRLVFETETPQQVTQGKVLGIDRGLYHMVVTSDGQFFSSSQVRATQRRYLHNRKRLQQKGTRSAKRRLKAMSGCEKRFMRDVNHCVTKKLANLPDVVDLSGIRKNRCGKKMNKWLGSWSFYQQDLFLAYKAEALGKRVVFGDPRYSSQKCNVCKHIRKTNHTKSRFHCRNCGNRDHSDWNAAKNHRDDYILSITQIGTVEQAAVNLPNASGLRL